MDLTPGQFTRRCKKSCRKRDSLKRLFMPPLTIERMHIDNLISAVEVFFGESAKGSQ